MGNRPFPLSARMQRNGANTYGLFVGQRSANNFPDFIAYRIFGKFFLTELIIVSGEDRIEQDTLSLIHILKFPFYSFAKCIFSLAVQSHSDV